RPCRRRYLRSRCDDRIGCLSLHCICPLLAQSGHPDTLNQCLLLGVKRTLHYLREYALSVVMFLSAAANFKLGNNKETHIHANFSLLPVVVSCRRRQRGKRGDEEDRCPD